MGASGMRVGPLGSETSSFGVGTTPLEVESDGESTGLCEIDGRSVQDERLGLGLAPDVGTANAAADAADGPA